MARRVLGFEQFNFQFQLGLGGVISGCGDIGEMLATADRIVDGDATSWCTEWIATADRVAAIADGCAGDGHQVSAREAYLRASAYYAQALSAVDGTEDPEALLQSTFHAHRRCFDDYVARLEPPGQQVEIPYEGTTMPGYLFTPRGTTGRHPTLVVNNGSDGPVTTLWPPLGAGAVTRGYNVLVFDGPGQQSMLFARQVPFRYDWEGVITPVVDYLSARPDGDPQRFALHCLSQGGYWVPRALAFEHRIAAGIADPGCTTPSSPGGRPCRRRCASASTPATGTGSTSSWPRGCGRRPRPSGRTGPGGPRPRLEERRVGEEGRSRGAPYH